MSDLSCTLSAMCKSTSLGEGLGTLVFIPEHMRLEDPRSWLLGMMEGAYPSRRILKFRCRVRKSPDGAWEMILEFD